ncbi:MAG: hypothetical protein ACRCWQ_02140 [Bacilli bacterium]
MVNEIQEAFAKYALARENLGKLFETEIDYDVIDLTNEKWLEADCEYVKYGLIGKDTFGDSEFDYSFEIYGSSRWQSHGYVLFVGYDWSGNRGMCMFDLANRLTN